MATRKRMSMQEAPELAGVLHISARQTGHLPVSLRTAHRQDAQQRIELPWRPQQGSRSNPSLSTRQMQHALVGSAEAGSTTASLRSSWARCSMSAETSGRLLMLILFRRVATVTPESCV